MVTKNIYDIVALEYKTQDVHQTTKESPTWPQIVEGEKLKIASYHHPHHPMRQQSFRKGGGLQQPSVPRGKKT